jgi:hypothetical protein
LNFFIKIFSLTLLLSLAIFAKPLHLSLDSDSLRINDPQKLPILLEERLQQSLNYGYPFARWILEYWHEDSTAYYAGYRLDKDKFIELDTVVYGAFSQKDVLHLRRVSEDSLLGIFSAERVLKAGEKINASGYLKANRQIQLDGSTLYLNTEPDRFTRFNALLSYQQRQNEQKGGLLGQFQIQIQNLIRLGRSAELSWHRPGLTSNRIQIAVNQRYVWDTPFSLGASFFQEFRDSLWVERHFAMHMNFDWQSGRSLGYRFSQEAIYPTLAGQDAGYLEANRLRNSLSYQRENHRASWDFFRKWALAYKGESENGFWQAEIYESIGWSPGSWGLKLELLGGKLANKTDYAPWELFRLGGPHFLRGAYHEQYLVSQYSGSIVSINWQEGKTRLSLFSDFAFIHKYKPLFQPGVSLSIPAGANELTILIGFDSTLPWQQGKFHLMWSL